VFPPAADDAKQSSVHGRLAQVLQSLVSQSSVPLAELRDSDPGTGSTSSTRSNNSNNGNNSNNSRNNTAGGVVDPNISRPIETVRSALQQAEAALL